MKRTCIMALALTGQVLLTCEAYTQGTTYLSGLDLPTEGSLSVASDAWVASWFQAGSNPGGYVLNTIQLAMGIPLGSPTGFTIAIWDFQNRRPLHVLSGPEPSTAGVFTYSASSFSLSPLGVYWFVVKSSTPATAGEFRWLQSSGTPNHFEYWAGGGYQTSTDGIKWARFSGRAVKFAVVATPIPEPGAPALLGFGVSLLWAGRRRRLRGNTALNKAHHPP